MPDNIDKLVKSSIKEYNNNQKKFFERLKEQYNETQIKEIKYDFKRRLDANFRAFMDDEKKQKQAVNKFSSVDYSKKKHQDIANHFLIPYRNIDKFEVESKYAFLNNLILLIFVLITLCITNDILHVSSSFLLVKIV